MMNSVPISLSWWDRGVLTVAVGGFIVLSWALFIDMTGKMAPMNLGLTPWTFADFTVMFGMWVVMMIGMMVPTAIRSILIFSRMNAKASTRGASGVAGCWFASGYIIVWVGFSVVATILQWGLEKVALLSPMMVASSPLLAALILIGAGIWQFTSLKGRCLRHCRSPLVFLATNYSKGLLGAIRMGAAHGFYCLGCCWMLMGLLFVGGVMNLACIAAVTAFVLAEKLLPHGDHWGRLAGVAMILIGLCYMVFGYI
ncbi:DUF2182 domain-containing protein [Leisingera methylohalidivorans]|uniref:Metal-binding protein n=1 Tax=Leisingera methylohalidivorans DSM 14336 TaxID=999552 RepID=V9W0M1_9RHOB|nr:DUF2182 domain-containing protein [Leisingera methylohalidivorans]AHD03688.1 hypothetical protein METH_22930 [Leisingera methylohalidivorans DSM 14336]